MAVVGDAGLLGFVGSLRLRGLRFGVTLGLLFLVDGGDGVEEELGEVTEGESVAAADALASELFGDVGEEGVDAFGGVEIAGSGEKLGGERFGIGLIGERGKGLGLAKVIGTERFVVDAEHAAMLAARTEVLTLIGGDDGGSWLRRHESSFRDVK